MPRRDEIRILRGSTANLDAFTPEQSELAHDTDTDVLRLGDGSTAGGKIIGPGSGGSPGMMSGRYYYPANMVLGTTSTVATGLALFYPVCVPHRLALASISTYVNTAAASTNCRIALYENDEGQPTNLLLESGSMSTATTGLKTYTPGSPLDLMPGWYWTAMQVDSSSPVFKAFSDLAVLALLGWDGITGPSNKILGYFEIQAYGAFPSVANVGISEITLVSPIVFLAR